MGSLGKVPWLCSCPTSHMHCACKRGTKFTSLFDPKVSLPNEYVAAELGPRKKTKILKGTAGPNSASLITERKKENAKKEST